jgi:flagellar biosynthetic protein FlhB
MSESEGRGGQEKTEEPTPKRLREAREKGEVARSRELSTTVVLLAGAVSLLFLGPFLLSRLEPVLTESFALPREALFDDTAPWRYLVGSTLNALLAIAPFLVILLLAAFIPATMVGGVVFSTKAFEPKLEKLDPIKGVKRMVSAKSIVEFVKTLAKFVLIFAVVVVILWLQADAIVALGFLELDPGMRALGEILGWSFLAFAAAMILIAAVDTPFQLYDHNKKLRMTRQEVKDEFKDTEGRPEVKQKQRQRQMEVASRRMMADVPKADVVITNPTHFAVALRYQAEQSAPRLVAKGSGVIAQKIREVAEEHQVAIVRLPPLARGLYFSTQLGDVIPSDLYMAVARVLAYVYQLNSGMDLGDTPEVDVPEEFLRKHGADLASLGER